MYGDLSFQFVGTVSQDRELGKLKNGQPRSVINVAINTPKKDRETGEWVEATTWVRVAVFGDRAGSASVDRCRKGMPVFMRGTMQSYTQEISGRNYTFYNFKPDVIRPLLSLEELSRKSHLIQNQASPPSDRPAAAAPSGAPPDNGEKSEHFNG